MKRLVLLFCALLLVACNEAVQDQTEAEPVQETYQLLQQQALSDDTAWNLLESLTTEVGSRLAGSEGDFKAVEWAVANMKEMGYDRVWTEPVEFPKWVRGHESGAIVSPQATDLDLAILGGVNSSGVPIEAEVVHFEDLAALEAMDDGSLEGQVAFISKSMLKSQDGSGYGRTVAQRTRGPFVAHRKGAMALLIRSVGTDTTNSVPHTGTISSSEVGEHVPAAALSNESADVLVEQINSGESVRVRLQLESGFEGLVQSANVIGEFDGSGESEEFVLIGGHLDSWDLGTGAHDDGAGVTITMSAAKLIADMEPRPERGIRVVLFANEEQGIYGAKQYAQKHAGELDSHVLGSESDLGAGRIYEFRVRLGEQAMSSLPELTKWLEPLGIPYNSSTLASGGADIGQMRRIGLPVIDLRHDASEYFDLHHTRNDVLENVDPADLQFNVAAYVTLLWWATNPDVVFEPVPPSP